MTIKIEKLHEKAEVNLVNNTLEFKCLDITTEVARDGRLILVYKTGTKVTVPEGVIGVLVQTDDACKYSLDMCSDMTIYNNGDNEVIAKYKANTNSIPSIIEPGEVFAKMVFINIEKIESMEVSDVAKEIEPVAVQPEIVEPQVSTPDQEPVLI